MLKQSNQKSNQILILIAAYAILHLVLFLQFGIVTNYEAKKYIEQAASLLKTGSYTTSNFRYYSIQIFLIALAQKWQLGNGFVVAVQILLNAASVYSFYRLVYRFSNNLNVSFFFTLAFIGMFYYQLYNVHLFTESLYFSFSILFFYALVRVSKFNRRNATVLLAGLIVLYFTRPVGIFFLPTTFVYVVVKFWRRKAFLIFSTASIVCLLLFLILLNTSLGSGGEFDFLLPYTTEMIICGVPTVSSPHPIVLPINQNSVQGLVYLLTHHTALVLQLYVKRLLAFFGVVRSYYSFSHNLFVGLYFYTLYALLFAGIKKWTKKLQPEIWFILTLVLLTAVTTALSCDEWHNRFLFTLLPFLLLLASLPFAQTKLPIAEAK